MDRLEEKRKIKAQAFHDRKVCFPPTTLKIPLDLRHSKRAAAKLRQKAIADTSASFEKLTALGY